ncbi:MAG: glycosyltransferase family 2 protein [Planctomycetota bacterium]|nr:MAG: glycosyltransferase family 2 protein [Planctomycetota bacterium]
MRILVAIPVYNEQRHVDSVLRRVLEFASDVLVIDDGSTDPTPCMLPKHRVEVIRHAENRGYGRSLGDAFRWAQAFGFDWVITMDCDEQHEPAAIPRFVEAIETDRWDIISGSRYLSLDGAADRPPEDRRAINRTLTEEINARLGMSITDAFCGFKAHRTSAIARLDLSETGYAFPMQLWVEAAAANLRITEIPVRLIYNDPSRTFGGPLNNPETRLAHYRESLYRALERRATSLPARALEGIPEPAVRPAATGCPA